MKIYYTYRKHWKYIKVIHLGVNISGCFETMHFTISVSLLFVTVGLSIYKSENENGNS